MSDFKVSVDNVNYNLKPIDRDIRSISERIGFGAKTVNHSYIKSFAQMISECGYTFCPATFSCESSFDKVGIRKKEYFDQLQLLALDFDSGISFDEVKERSDRYELPILFAYETFSSVNKDKFRVAILNDVSINNVNIAEAAIQGLMKIFPEADSSCKDVSRMFFGGKKKLLHFDESIPTTNLEALFRNMSLCLKERHGATHYRRKIAEISRNTGIGLNEKGLIDISVDYDAENCSSGHNGKNLPSSSIILTTSGNNLPIKSYKINLGDSRTKAYAPRNKSNHHRPFRSHDLKKISTQCKLFQEFESGSRILHHCELFGLATNLIHVETGDACFGNILKTHSYFDDRPDKYSDWKYYLYYIKGKEGNRYNPHSCSGFCPHEDKCPHGANIISTCLIQHHQIERIAGYVEQLYSIEEAEKDFKRQFAKAFNSKEKQVFIIKACCALGKTQTILEQLLNGSQAEPAFHALIAVPTIALKSEVCQRARDMGIKIVESPSLRTLKDDLPIDVWERIEELYSTGISPIPYIKKLIGKSDSECMSLFEQYLKDLDKFTNAEVHAITTHKRLENMDVSKYDLVIIDEDIIFNSIFRSKISINIASLKKAKKKIAPGSAISKKINEALKTSKAKELFTLSKVAWDREDNDDIPKGVDMPAFASATHFISRNESDRNEDDDQGGEKISFIKPANLLKNIKNTKVIMVSATVDERICKYYFGNDRVDFYECKQAEYAGVLNQYYDRSYSRRDIAKDTSIFAKITKATGFLHTISFKKFRNLLENYDGMHYGNTEGRDHCKGKDINAIGTPHQPEWIYKLCAYTLGLDFDEDEELNSRTVDHNGYRFRFMTYADKVLRAIQFYFIESELEQAVGRARLLRFDCTVNLFSNFPLRQAVMMKWEFETSV